MNNYMVIMRVGDEYLTLSSSMGGVIIGERYSIRVVLERHFIGKDEENCRELIDKLITFDTYIIPIQDVNDKDLEKRLLSKESSLLELIDLYTLPIDPSAFNIEDAIDYNRELISFNKQAILEYRQPDYKWN